jgi:hypothetical protein
MGGSGGVVEAIRRVPPVVVWAVLAVIWVMLLRIVWPDSKPYEYLQSPIYTGVAMIAARKVPRRYVPWLPVLIAVAVTLPVVLIGKALS